MLPLDSEWQAFECEIEFTRRAGDGGFNLNLPSKVGECPLVFDYPGTSGGVSLGSKTKGVVLIAGSQIVTERRMMMRVDVGRQQEADHVSIALNSKKVGEWSGDRNEISNASNEGFPQNRRVSIWIPGGRNEYVFHRIRVRLLDGGSAESLRPVLSTAQVPAAKPEPSPETKPTVAQTQADVPKL